eukprot:TRINITY_DN6376_c0_g1_i1.p1 TRINITY_DN6376_c0_g1~~TRINITY_DN6376_c0_g1_i1.p1  ORF type:complete len:225 (-),score=12.75 TRINITY_DN6376_c0_g1_i1:144-818(-)
MFTLLLPENDPDTIFIVVDSNWFREDFSVVTKKPQVELTTRFLTKIREVTHRSIGIIGPYVIVTHWDDATVQARPTILSNVAKALGVDYLTLFPLVNYRCRDDAANPETEKIVAQLFIELLAHEIPKHVQGLEVLGARFVCTSSVGHSFDVTTAVQAMVLDQGDRLLLKKGKFHKLGDPNFPVIHSSWFSMKPATMKLEIDYKLNGVLVHGVFSEESDVKINVK